MDGLADEGVGAPEVLEMGRPRPRDRRFYMEQPRDRRFYVVRPRDPTFFRGRRRPMIAATVGEVLQRKEPRFLIATLLAKYLGFGARLQSRLKIAVPF
jgi:hypothetical protein